jgi:peroxiredoxin
MRFHGDRKTHVDLILVEARFGRGLFYGTRGRRLEAEESMAIMIGDRIPDVSFTILRTEGPKLISANDYFKDRKIALFAVPGAFTPTCDKSHLPGFLAKEGEIKGKGVDAIAVTAVNDVWTLYAWLDLSKAQGAIDGLADGSAVFAKAVGLALDLVEHGLGLRSKRYSMIVNDGTVERLNVEEKAGVAKTSSAEALLAQL